MKGAKKKSRGLAGVYGALRALGAFRHHGQSLSDALYFEATTDRPRAAIPLHDVLGQPHEAALSRGVHLLFNRSAIEMVYDQDCWSVERKGVLYPTCNVRKRGIKGWNPRNPECFIAKGAKPLAIVVHIYHMNDMKNYWHILDLAAVRQLPVVCITEVKAFLRGKAVRFCYRPAHM